MKPICIKWDVTINAPVEEVFPLICPVREYDWIPGWKCTLVFCPNGRNEKDVVFKEKMSSPFLLAKIGARTTWTTVLHDKSNNRVHFRWDTKISSSLYKMELFPVDSSQTRCTISLNFQINNDSQLTKLKPNSKYKIAFLIEGLASMLKHYCETGEQLSSRGSKRKSDFIESLSVPEKLTFLLNKMTMMLSRDRDKISYLSNGQVSSKTLRKKK
jgi:hypothetical protein